MTKKTLETGGTAASAAAGGVAAGTGHARVLPIAAGDENAPLHLAALTAIATACTVGTRTPSPVPKQRPRR